MALEEPAYKLLLSSGNVEFRAYEPYIVAEVSIRGAAADRQAFQILADYIFGGNKSGEKMAMTAPVESHGGNYAFVMENRFSMEELPEPNDERVQLRVKPARIVAVRRFSGRWSERNIANNEAQLLAELASLGIETTAPPELARYNSPFTPWFLRRNEIIVPVDWRPADQGAAIAGESPARL
jgi:hypothetical protein